MANVDDNFTEYWTTTDLGLAASIITAGASELVDLDRSNPKRVVFVFLNTSSLNKTIANYWSGGLNIEAKKLVENLKSLKGRVYNG